MSKSNRKCKIDLKSYKYCISCYEDRNKPTWMNMFCCERCKNVFDTLVACTLNKKTKEETRQALLMLDLSDLESFEEEVKNQIKNILSSEENMVVESKEVYMTEEEEKKSKKVSNKLK